MGSGLMRFYGNLVKKKKWINKLSGLSLNDGLSNDKIQKQT